MVGGGKDGVVMMERLREAFREEAQEILTELKGSLLKLEASPDDADAIGWVLRALHTIRGAGGLAGFHDMASLAYECEKAYEGVRTGRVKLAAPLLDLSLSVVDVLRRFLHEDGLTIDDPQAAALITALRQHQPSDSLGDAGGKAPEPSNEETTYRIRFRPPADLFQRGINPVGLLRELASLGPCRSISRIESIPPLTELDPYECYLYWDIVLTTRHDIRAIRDVFLFVEGESQVDIERT
jgi:two-component system, chemotaxis family, sensor kinase CheA